METIEPVILLFISALTDAKFKQRKFWSRGREMIFSVTMKGSDERTYFDISFDYVFIQMKCKEPNGGWDPLQDH